MKRIIKLTERDLIRIVKRVISESKENDSIVNKNHLEESVLDNITDPIKNAISRYGKRALNNMGKEYRTWSFRLGDGNNKIAAKEFVDYHNASRNTPHIYDDEMDEVIITINPDMEETMWEDGGIRVGYYSIKKPNDYGTGWSVSPPEKIPLKFEHYESMSPKDLGIKVN